MKNGGQIPWNAIPICETFKISCLMGRLHTKDVLENLKKGPIIPFGSLVENYPISAKDQSRIHQFGKKVLPGLFFGCALYAGGMWKSDIMVADIEELETMDASKIYSKKDSMQRKFYFPKKMENNFSSRRWTKKFVGGDQEQRTFNLDTGPPNSRRKSKRFSWRIRRVSTFITSRLISGCR